jgi:hypothetical protein
MRDAFDLLNEFDHLLARANQFGRTVSRHGHSRAPRGAVLRRALESFPKVARTVV